MGPLAAMHIERSVDRRAARGAVHVPSSRESHEFLWHFDQSGCPGLAAGRTAVEGCALVVWSPSEFRLWCELLAMLRLPDWVDDPVCLRELAGRLLPAVSVRSGPADLARRVHLPVPDEERPSAFARFLAAACEALLSTAPHGTPESPAEISHWLAETRPRVDFSRFGFGPEFLESMPDSPGVYLMRNRAGHIIYVGQSSNLRRRLRSYFSPKSLLDPKVSRIHRHLYRIEALPSANKIEALILEMQFIRDFRPTVNLQFEVHEPRRAYGRTPNAIFLVPSGNQADAYFLREGTFVGEMRAALGKAPGKALRAKVRSLYFSGHRQGSRVEPWEAEIVARWFASNRRDVNFVDPDEAGSLDETLRRLAAYLRDPDRLSRKVIYR